MPLGGLTVEFVDKELSIFNCKFEDDQDFVNKLNALSQSLQLEAYDLINMMVLYAWYLNTKKLNVDSLDAFEQSYKKKEAHAWVNRWNNFRRQLNEKAMLDIADDAEEQPPTMDDAAAVEDANHAMGEDIDWQGDEEAMFDIADDAEEQPPAMDYAAAVEDAIHADRFVWPARIIFQDGFDMAEDGVQVVDMVYYDDNEEPVVEVVEDEIVFDEHEDRPEMSIRTRPTEEQIAHVLREQDQSDPAPTRFTRACLVCATKNPRKRGVFTICGHIVCYPCAVENARSEASGGRCVFCRATSGLVMLLEEECGRDENNSEVNRNNRQLIDPRDISLL